MDLMVPGIPVPLGARSTAPAARLVWGEPSGLFVDWVNHSLMNKGGGKDWSGEPFDKFTKGRTSTATYFDSTGLMQTAASGVPRYDYNPATRLPRGYLKEGARTNLCLQSGIASGWTSVSATLTVNQTTSPDGTTTAAKLVENTGSATHYFRASAAITISNATTYTFSIFVKPNGRTWVAIQGDMISGFLPLQYFNLSGAGTVGTLGSGVTSAAIQALPNGWYRCTVVGASSGTSVVPGFFLATGQGGNNYTGDGASGVYTWGAQLELGGFGTSYIPTTTGSVTRAGDTFSIATSALGWFDATQVSMRLNGEYAGATGNQYPLTFNDGSIANEVGFNLATSIGLRVRSGSADQANIAGTPTAQFAWAGHAAANDFLFYQNGAQVGSPDTSGSMPTGITTLSGDAAATESFVWYRDAVLVPRLWSASELAARSVVS